MAQIRHTYRTYIQLEDQNMSVKYNKGKGGRDFNFLGKLSRRGCEKGCVRIPRSRGMQKTATSRQRDITAATAREFVLSKAIKVQ